MGEGQSHQGEEMAQQVRGPRWESATGPWWWTQEAGLHDPGKRGVRGAWSDRGVAWRRLQSLS